MAELLLTTFGGTGLWSISCVAHQVGRKHVGRERSLERTLLQAESFLPMLALQVRAAGCTFDNHIGCGGSFEIVPHRIQHVQPRTATRTGRYIVREFNSVALGTTTTTTTANNNNNLRTR